MSVSIPKISCPKDFQACSPCSYFGQSCHFPLIAVELFPHPLPSEKAHKEKNSPKCSQSPITKFTI